jgi:hypothetical protein
MLGENKMNDICKILLTSFLTVCTGAFVLVFGQVVIRFIIDPIHNLKKTLGEIDFALAFHARAIGTSIGKKEADNEAQKELMKLSCELRAKIEAIPWYSFWSACSCCSLPSKKSGFAASKHLRELSNSVHVKESRSNNSDIVNKIGSLLNLEIEQ